MSFENIIGNDNIKNTLIDNINKNKILNSYMFVGQDGIGKKKFAEEFSKMILCLSEEKDNCNKCESCVKFISMNHPDYLEIQPDGNYIKIAQIRQMQEEIYKKPIISEKKVFIINDAEKMTEEAQNSLLKTLEEPPEYIAVILIVSNENLLLNTIKSRCMKLYFNNISKEQILTYINNNKIIEKPTENLLDMCNGSIGKAEKISKNINYYIEVEKLINKLVNNNYDSIIQLMKESTILYKSKDNIYDILEYMIVIFYNLIRKENAKYFNVIKIIENAKLKLRANSNYDMTIDELILKIWEEVNEKYSRN